ncbi:MAG: transglycosylase SLT domain-containing protein [Prevotella sp.]|nr:transglycosylase SLT domain-containing protein [Prevotella sp.]
MRKLMRTACLTCMILMLAPIDASAGTKGKKDSRFDWNPVIDAIIEVESEGKADAIDKSGKSCGILQITPILVRECNRILRLRNSSKRYDMGDRFSASKSKEMFLLYQSFYNPANNVEQAIRSWNGGMNYTKRGTQRYYEKVMSKMKS